MTGVRPFRRIFLEARKGRWLQTLAELQGCLVCAPVTATEILDLAMAPLEHPLQSQHFSRLSAWTVAPSPSLLLSEGNGP